MHTIDVASAHGRADAAAHRRDARLESGILPARIARTARCPRSRAAAGRHGDQVVDS
jgi:hypothetical protein